MKRWLPILLAGLSVAGCSYSSAPAQSGAPVGVTGTLSAHLKKHHQKTHQLHVQLTVDRPQHLLCIYPAHAGATKIVSPLAGTPPFADWANACSLNGGYPTQRLSSTLLLEPRTTQVFKIVGTGLGGWFVRLASSQ
jgi:hypothetical protein